MDYEASYRYSVFFPPELNFSGLLTTPERPWNVGGTGQACALLVRALAQRGDTEIILQVDQPLDYAIDVPNVTARLIQPAAAKWLQYLFRIVNHFIKQDDLQDKSNRAFLYLARSMGSHAKRSNFQYRGDQAIFFSSTVLPPNFISHIKDQHIPLVLWNVSDSLTDGGALNSTIWQKGYDRCIETADIVVVQNATQQQDVLKFHHRDSIIMMPGIVAPLANGLEEERSDCALGAQPELLWIGRCNGMKRPWALLPLAHALPEYKIKVIMAQKNDDDFDRTIRYDLAHCPNVTLIDGMPHEEIMALYHQDIIMINTSAREGLPNTFIEAASAQRPFVSLESPLGGILDESLHDNSLGLCAKGDIDLMVQQVRTLASNPQIRLHIGQAANRYVYEHLNADKIASEWISFIETLSQDFKVTEKMTSENQ